MRILLVEDHKRLSFLTGAIAALYAMFFIVSLILFPQVALTILLITIVSVKCLFF
jgi:hypothetical protein